MARVAEVLNAADDHRRRQEFGPSLYCTAGVCGPPRRKPPQPQADTLIQTLGCAMQTYLDPRSETWQDGDKGDCLGIPKATVK
jgi:hypothetical protein